MLEVFGLTDVGRKREHNEDTFAIDEEASFFAVLDGLGGHKAGEIASGLAAEALGAFIHKSHHDKEITWPYGLTVELSFDGNRLYTGIGLANKKVFRAADGRPDYTGMGTTIVAAIVSESLLTTAWVGDSRAYLLRGGSIQQLTTDHTWVEMAVAKGILSREEAKKHRYASVLVQAVGGKDSVEPDIVETRLENEDIVLLCSDGLHGMVNAEDVTRLLAPPRTMEEGARKLVAAANEAGGKDNITVVLLRYSA
jgi:serine/threonine protein phosphatase PrpC